MKRSRFVASICVAIAALGASAAHAQPVELDTDAAHIIVVRPIDMWSGDTSTLDATLAAVRERKVSYDVKLDGTRYRGSPLVLQGVQLWHQRATGQELEDADLLSAQGNTDLGDVETLVLDANGALTSIVVELEGPGDPKVVVPVAQISSVDQNGEKDLTTTLTAAQLQALPAWTPQG